MLQIRYPAGRDPEWHYILHVVCSEYLGIPYEALSAPAAHVEISLTEDPQHRTLRVASELLGIPEAQWLTPASLPTRPLTWTTPANDTRILRQFSDRLPVLFGKLDTAGRCFEEADHGITIGIDIFGSAFFMLTRYEEYVATERDEYHRFPSTFTLAVREGFHRRPVVHEYLEILWTCMCALWPHLERRQPRYRVILTHDVDSPTSQSWPAASVMKHVLVDLTMRHEPKLAFRRSAGLLYERFTGQSPPWDVLNTFSFLMDTAEQFGLTTTFNFHAFQSATYNDSTYAAADLPIRTLMRDIRTRGHVIGYHASFQGYENATTLRREVAELKRVSCEEGITQARWGGRHHFLKWRNPETWQWWDDAGLAYDSSLGFSDEVGFRCGCCFEFPVYNLATRRVLQLREQPLIFMDVALMENQRLSSNAMFDAMSTLSGTCRRCRGDLVLLWHNTSVVGQRDRKMYLDLVSGIV